MNDERIKQAEKWDYFDEWLARIHDIGASEKRFYQKVRNLYASAVDYDKTSEQAQLFFKKMQNKMLWAVTGKTVAELITDRSDPNKANMGLTSFKGSIVRKGDIGTAKNYLQQDEIDELNRIVTMYLDYAEDQAKKRKIISMDGWADKLDVFLEFNERDLLIHAGRLKMEVARKLASERYDEFDAKRKEAEAIAADEEDIKELENLEKKLTKRDGGGDVNDNKKVPLGQIAILQSGFGLPSYKRMDGNIPIVSSRGISGKHNESKVRAPGVATGRKGSLGKSYYLEQDFWPLDTALWVKDFHGNNPKYVYYLLSSLNFDKFSSKTGVPGVNRHDLHKIKVSFVEPDKQDFLVESLEQWDAAIKKTEALIDAKERQFGWLQKSLMDKDFKSYSIHLSEYADIMKQQKIEEVGELKPLTVKLHCKGIEPNERDVQITLSKKGRPYFQRFAGEFLIGRQNFHNGGFGIVPSQLDGFIASNAITTLEINESKLDPRYLFYFFSRKDYYLRIGHIMDGTGQKELSDKQIMKLPVSIPSIERQKEVVSLLDTAQKEINLLKKLAAQYHTQKRGLMQKLLSDE